MISMLLTLALVLSPLPSQALVLDLCGEPPDQGAFKVMRMDGVKTGSPIS